MDLVYIKGFKKDIGNLKQDDAQPIHEKVRGLTNSKETQNILIGERNDSITIR